MLVRNPQIRTITLDVQQRTVSAVRFYQQLGFVISGEEEQSVNGTCMPYFNMTWCSEFQMTEK